MTNLTISGTLIAEERGRIERQLRAVLGSDAAFKWLRPSGDRTVFTIGSNAPKNAEQLIRQVIGGRLEFHYETAQPPEVPGWNNGDEVLWERLWQ